jgi:hypothetical protein
LYPAFGSLSMRFQALESRELCCVSDKLLLRRRRAFLI